MLNLDMRTLSFLATLSSMLLAVGLLLVRRIDAKSPSVRFWAMGASINGVGYLLLALRGVIPDMISIVVANSLLPFGFGCLYVGHRRFEGAQNDPSWHWFLTAATAALFYYFTYPMPSLTARIVVISAATAAVLFPSAMVLLRSGDIRDQMIRRFLAAAYLTTAFLDCVRAIVTPLIPSPGLDFMAATSHVQTLALVFVIGLNVALGIGLPLLILGGTQRRLVTSEERYRTLIEWSPEPLAVHRGGKVIYVNPASIQMFGANSAQDLLGKPVLDLVHPDFHHVVMARVQAPLERHAAAPPIEEKFLKLDGTVIDVEVQNISIDYDGEPAVQVAMRNITERKRAEASMRESEQELRSIFDAALDGIMVASADTRKLLIANAAICNMLGYTREEIVGMNVADIHPKPDLPRVLEKFERQLRGEALLDANIPMIRKDGSVFYADIKAARFHLNGRDAMLGIFRDTTERIRAERDLIESEARFRGLVEQSITGIYIIQDGSLAYVNPRFAEIRGYSSADELVGHDPLPLIAEKDRGTVAENNRRLLAGEVPSIDYSFIALRKDGSSVDVGVHSALATYRGRPAIIGLLQDISEKKRAEEKINHYIAQLERAFMSTVEVATVLSEMRDPYTAGHERRVAEIAVAIGAELGFDPRRQEGLRVAGYLHDIGKITIPAEILSKPGKLSPIEYSLIQGHAQASYDVLKDVEFPWPIAQIALQHHERMDGSGYPQGLKGEAILLDARIMAVADVVEAMSSHRPYRPGLGIEAALAEVKRGREISYDPVVADACLNLFREKGYAIPA